MTFPIAVVGVGPGSRDYLLPEAKKMVLEADLLVGGRNALALFDELDKEQYLIGSDLDGVLEFISAARRTRRVAVLLSGDPGFFSLLPRLQQRFGSGGIAVVPGISSLQLACARLGIKWDRLNVASVHGRGLDGLKEIAGAERAAVLTEPGYPPAAVCKHLLEQGCGFTYAWVFTDLCLPGEKIAYGSLEAMAGLQGGGNSILILFRDELGPEQLREPAEAYRSVGSSVPGENPVAPSSGARAPAGRSQPGEAPRSPGGEAAGLEPGEAADLDAYLDVVTPGLPDRLFIQGEAAMSREEARALALCKARLKRGMVVYEIRRRDRLVDGGGGAPGSTRHRLGSGEKPCCCCAGTGKFT